VIDAKLDREDHNSIPAIVTGRGLKPLNAKTDTHTDETCGKKIK
jgi:hypothetical protein